MRKKLLATLLTVGLGVFTLASCGGGNFPSQAPDDNPSTVPSEDKPSTTPSTGTSTTPSTTPSTDPSADPSTTPSTTPSTNETPGPNPTDTSTEETKPTEEEKYTINFIIDGSIYKTLITKPNEAIVMPADPIKHGYDFVGWFTDKDVWKNEFNPNSLLEDPIKENLDVYAFFRKKENNKDAEIEIKNSVLKNIDELGSVYYIECDESQSIYNFTNNVTINGEGSYVITRDLDGKDDIPSKNVSLVKGENNVFYLHLSTNNKIFVYPVVIYRHISLTISFDSDGGSVVEPITIKKGEILKDVPVTEKTGYSFKGWSYDFTKPVMENITAKAAYEANKYEITYDLGYDDKTSIVEVEYNSTVDLLKPERAGYKFNGWLLNGKLIESLSYTYTENIELKASWSVQAVYNITYNKNGGVTFEQNPTSYTVGAAVELYDCVKPGHTFKGWQLDDGTYLGDRAIGIDLIGDIHLTAIFEALEATVTLDYGYDDITEVIDIKYNEILHLPEPERYGYEFLYWTLNGSEYRNDEPFWQYTSITLEAKWKLIERIDYTVKVRTISGKPVENATVTFSNGEVSKGIFTDEKGMATYNAPKGIYDVLVEVPEGYILSETEQQAEASGTPLEFVCTTEVITSLPDKDKNYKLYDIMHDFTLVDSDGREVKLSEVLASKNTVILNFWYSGCQNCFQEFPHMDDAYKAISSKGVPYSNDVEIIAVNPVIANNPYEDQAFVTNFKNTFYGDSGLSFEMLTDYNALTNGQYKKGENYLPALNTLFKVDGYPTTIVIDRYASIQKIIVGSVPDTEKWKDLFEDYISDNYVPVYDERGIEEEAGFVKNRVDQPDYTKFNSIVAGISYDGTKFNASYSRETNIDDEAYSWPWVPGADGRSLVPSNLGVDMSYSILYIEVPLKKNQVFTFDIYYNIEQDHDMLFVLANDLDILHITGRSMDTVTKLAYPAAYDDTYTFGFLFMKDNLSSPEGEALAISNLRIENTEAYEEDVYIYREASSGEYSDYLSRYEYYINPVFNEVDNYYHVETKDGPLLMANLLGKTHFNSKNSLYEMVAAGSKDIFIIDGVDYGSVIMEYAGYAADSKVGAVPVTKELREALIQIVRKLGKEESRDNSYQWLELCVYYDVYGPAKTQMPSPIKGLAPWEALSFTPGKTTANVYYDRVLLNKGYLVEFKPSVSGVYRFRSTTNPRMGGTDLLIYDDKLNVIGANDRFTREQAIIFDLYRMDMPVEYEFNESANFIAYFYFEAGKTYYLRPYFIEQLNDVNLSFGYELMQGMSEILTIASSDFFTTDNDNLDENIDVENHIISRNYIEPVLGPDGYYQVAGSNAKDKYIYFDAKQSISVLGTVFYKDLFTPTDEKGNILPSAFDFRYDERGTLRVNNRNEVLKTVKDKDGFDKADSDGNLIYSYEPLLNDYGMTYVVYDATEAIKQIVERNMIHSDDIMMDGLVRVDRELAEILQMLMDKYTFMGVENSWLKLCYYNEYLGK